METDLRVLMKQRKYDVAIHVMKRQHHTALKTLLPSYDPKSLEIPMLEISVFYDFSSREYEELEAYVKYKRSLNALSSILLIILGVIGLSISAYYIIQGLISGYNFEVCFYIFAPWPSLYALKLGIDGYKTRYDI